MTELTSLIERLEKAEGSDFALAAEIWQAVTGEPVAERPVLKTGWCRLYGAEIPDIMGSLDAALALVEQKLPGWFWSIGPIDPDTADQGHHEYGALVHPHFGVADPRDGLGHGATPAIAILLALLRSLSQEEANG